jgi:hypothetical protein
MGDLCIDRMIILEQILKKQLITQAGWGAGEDSCEDRNATSDSINDKL